MQEWNLNCKIGARNRIHSWVSLCERVEVGWGSGHSKGRAMDQNHEAPSLDRNGLTFGFFSVLG